MTSPHWDPQQYTRHAAHRTRPLRDLLARVPEPPSGPGRPAPRVADLGCGPGGPTALLADRWPTAVITGYDNSPTMLAEAAALAGPTAEGGSLAFAQADIATWRPAEPLDLIVSNAALQWVPGHPDLLGGWIAALNPAGALAFQVPGNFDAPSHRLLHQLCAAPRWRGALSGVLREEPPVLTPEGYLTLLSGLDPALGVRADVWETTYLQLLPGEDAVLEWTKGTALRPVLTVLESDPEARDAFLAEYRDLLRDAYPPGPAGTLFPFRRIFVVARRGDDGGAPPSTAQAPQAARSVTSPHGSEPGITGVDHVLLAAPPGSEDRLRAFYAGALGMTEVPKPPVLAARGGCWFTSGDCQLHLGIEQGYRPPAKAHPGILVRGLPEYAARLESAGVRLEWDDNLPGHRRAYVVDPVGNRLELLERLP